MHEKPNFNNETVDYALMYRRLAKVMHPDKGGSNEQMHELERVFSLAKSNNFEELMAMYNKYVRDEQEKYKSNLATVDEAQKQAQQKNRQFHKAYQNNKDDFHEKGDVLNTWG